MTSLCTLFSCPKAFSGHDGLIQVNALRNWKSLGVDIVLLGDDPGVAEAAAEYGCLHIPELEKTEYGTPLLSDIFAKAQEAAETPLMCYSNADILFPPSILSAAAKAYATFPICFLLLGRRWDVDVKELLDFSGEQENFFDLLRSQGSPHALTGMDYFIFPKGTVALPPFAIGRPGWDAWMMWDAKRRGLPVIDATVAVGVIHQNHGYDHVPGKAGPKWQNSPEAFGNKAILQDFSQKVRWSEVLICSANKQLTRNYMIIPNLSPNRMGWFLLFRWYRIRNGLWSQRGLLKRIIGEMGYSRLKKFWHLLLGKKHQN